MDAKLEAPEARPTEFNMGDYVTWGTKTSAHEIVGFEDERLLLEGGHSFWLGSEIDFGVSLMPSISLEEAELVRKAHPEAFEETDETPTLDDIIVRPSHYTDYEIEPIEFIMKNEIEFWRGNIIKYSTRAGKKLYEGKTPVQSEITDLRKVIRYSEMRINQLEGLSVL